LETFVAKSSATPQTATNKTKGREIYLTTINNVTTDLDTNILHFTLCDLQEGNHLRKRSETKEPFKAAAISHSLLDSGAIGSCVISPNFFKYISTNNYIKSVDNVKYHLSAALTNKSISLNKKYSFTILLKSERPQQAQLVSVAVDAVVAKIPYDLILDRDTIKRYDLVAHFPSHFAAGALLNDILSLELPNKKQRSFDNTLTTKSSSTIQHETKSKSESLIAKQAALASLHIEERRNLKLNERNVWKRQQELSRSLQAQYEHHSLISEDKLAYLATLGNVDDRPQRGKSQCTTEQSVRKKCI
jgi:hypothetical protein